ncbi:MAG: T9SS type A sorting domain-containing protein [Bacteroidia bacterium]
MKFVYTTIIAIIFANQLYSQCANTSNIYTFTYATKTYEVIKEQKSWKEASACAVERGGYLVEINDVNEQNAVYNAIINGAGVSPTYTSIENGGGIAYVWIGATDQRTEGIWLWDGNNDSLGINFWKGEGANGSGGGTAVGSSYINWGGTSVNNPNEPDNYDVGQHHAAIGLAGWPEGTTMLGVASEWNDIIGSSELYYVVEKDNATGIKDNKTILNGDLRMYPNPTNSMVTFDIYYDLIEIYDLNGKLLKQLTNANSVDFVGFNKGTYLIKTTEKSIIKFGKFILN